MKMGVRLSPALLYGNNTSDTHQGSQMEQIPIDPGLHTLVCRVCRSIAGYGDGKRKSKIHHRIKHGCIPAGGWIAHCRVQFCGKSQVFVTSDDPCEAEVETVRRTQKEGPVYPSSLTHCIVRDA